MASVSGIFKLILKGLASIIAIVLTILFVIQVIIIVHFDKLIEDSLKETVLVSTNELYSIDFKNISVNVFTGSIKATEVRLKPDTVVYRRLKEIKKAPNLLFEINIPDFRVSRINLYKAYFDKELDLHKIYLKDPQVSILNEPLNRKKTPQRDPLDLYPLISSMFKKAGTDFIEIINGSFSYKKVSKAEKLVHSLDHVSIKFTNVNIDSTAYSDRDNFLYSEDINASILNYSIRTPDSLYLLKFGKAALSTRQKKVTLSNISLNPLHSKYAFSKVYGQQIDRLILKIKNCEFRQVNIRTFLDEESLELEDLLIENISLSAFRDKRTPRDLNRRPKMPQTALKNLGFGLKIKRVRVRDLNVEYEEFPEKGKTSGKVSFKHIFARITDINNDSLAIAKGQTVWIRAEGLLMGKGPVKAKFRVPLNSNNNTYYYSGSVGKMPLKELNGMIVPSTSIEIKDGLIKLLEFEVTANDDKAEGSMRFYYSDLKVQLINKKSEDTGFKEMIGSFIANNFIVESNNPQNGVFRTGKMYFERDKSKFIFNYWWKTILSGIKPSIGLSEEKQESIKQFQSKMELRKKKREERKKERQEKRQTRKNKDSSKEK